VEGRSIAIEYRWAEGKPERIHDLTAELVRLPVDVIVTVGEPGGPAAKQATSTIPIVAAAHPDPVRTGLVASLARPGRNITGLSSMNAELGEKRLELLKEAVPKLSRVAVLRDPWQPSTHPRPTEAAARALGLRLQVLEMGDIKDLEPALAAAKKGRAGALTIMPSPVLSAHRVRLVEGVTKVRLPAIYHLRELVAVGGLLS
jgi:putative ABC transport system substrate-binding protein